MCIEFVIYGSKTKECTCIFSCWDGNCVLVQHEHGHRQQDAAMVEALEAGRLERRRQGAETFASGWVSLVLIAAGLGLFLALGLYLFYCVWLAGAAHYLWHNVELPHWAWLRGPTAIVLISCDTCSDSIAKVYRACFYGVAQLSRDTLQNRVLHRCACVKLSSKGGGSHLCGGVLISLKRYRAIWGIAAIVSQYRAIWGH